MAESYQNILLEKNGHRANIVINRPEKRNALNNATIAELVAAFSDCRADPEVRVIVLSGAGDKAFCAGADLAETQQSASEYQRFVQRETFVGLFEMIPKLGKPVIASVQGAALAGGCGLAVACDFVIASDRARFGTPEINVGLFPMMISAILIRNLGRKKAYDMMFTGRMIDANEAERIGLVTRVVPAEHLQSEVDSLADELAAKSPAILKLGKDALYNAGEMPFSESLRYLSSMLTMSILTEDSKEGLTAFVEKRKPEWKGQ
ncbi:MAG TPA: enoyl-CoA hydratase-related protein [Chloroflexia bacterium]|nr:enoyl-CoA hydratase-related protein [Chloroflexia bacterium]